jgi:hypothetical protein
MFLNLTTLAKLFTTARGIVVRRSILYMISCLLHYKLTFERHECAWEISRVQKALRTLRSHNKLHKMYDHLMSLQICSGPHVVMPILQPLCPVNIIHLSRNSKMIPHRVYSIYRFLAPLLDSYYMIAPGTKFEQYTRLEYFPSKYFSGYTLYNWCRDIIKRDKLTVNKNLYIILCSETLKTLTGFTLVHEMELYLCVFRDVWKLPETHQKLCAKVFRKDSIKEKRKAMTDFHDCVPIDLPKITPEMWINPNLRYSMSSGLMRCFACLESFRYKENYSASEIITTTNQYMDVFKNLFFRTNNKSIALLVGTELYRVFGNVNVFHKNQLFYFIKHQLTVVNNK